MRKIYFTLPVSLLFFGTLGLAQDQTFEEEFEPIRQELTNWDAVRGPWLAESMVAISNQNEIPDRTFPENLTPAQVMDLVPSDVSSRVQTLTSTRTQPQTHDTRWDAVNSFIARRNCNPVSGRSYGDPHLESFDGASYSFQTVGEFDLVKSNDGLVEIQTRQKAQQDNFSLNTAVAMNVGGDRVGIYAEDSPDGGISTPVRVNGMAVDITDRPYFLSRGGTIRKSRGMYVVDWPTGESVTAQVRNSGGMSFLNITTNIYPCSHGGYSGLMGNANHISSDDYNDGRGLIPVSAGSGPNATYVKRQQLAMIAREFAEQYRITMATSLFDYPAGTSTYTFTDKTFPRVHMTVDDLTPAQRTRAQQHCQQNGISGAQMEGCIFDNAYLNLPPTPRHVVDDPTEGIVFKPVDKPVRNINGNNPSTPSKPTTVFDTKKPTVETHDVRGGAQPMTTGGDIDKQDTKNVSSPATPTKTVNEPSVKPRTSPAPSPTPKISVPKTSPTPRSVPAPRPAPAPRPTPVPAPKPSAPKVGTPIRGGGLH